MKSDDRSGKHVLYTWLDICVQNEALFDDVHPRASLDRSHLTYMDLCNGYYLNCIMHYVYPEAKRDHVEPQVSNIALRLRNLTILMNSFQSFYRNVLKQQIVMHLPDMVAIARNPEPEMTDEEMKKVLLLLLGCVVQSDRREEFINQIKSLDTATQQSLANEILKITNGGKIVLNVSDWQDSAERGKVDLLVEHLTSVIEERNEYVRHMLEMSQEQESSSSSGFSLLNDSMRHRKLLENQQHDYREGSTERHVVIELAECKAQLRRSRQEVEEKAEMINLYKDEILEKDVALAKLRQENFELLKNLSLLNEYRDEVDVLRERTVRYVQLEADCEKYKERLSELDFLKSRVEELREENHVLLETRAILEEQVGSLRHRLGQNSDREADIVRLHGKVADLEQQAMLERRRVQQLLEENSRLEKESFELQNRSAVCSFPANGDRSTEGEQADHDSVDRSSSNLCDQLNESITAKLLQLEFDNKKLRQMLQSSESDANLGDLNLSAATAYCSTAWTKTLFSELKEAMATDRVTDRRLDEMKQRECELARSLADAEMTNRSLSRKLAETEDECQKIQEQLRSVQSAAAAQPTAVELGKLVEELKAANMEACGRNSLLLEEIGRKDLDLKEVRAELEKQEAERISVEAQLSSAVREHNIALQENEKLRNALQTANTEVERVTCEMERCRQQCLQLAGTQNRNDSLEAANADLKNERKNLRQQIEFQERKIAALSEDLIFEKQRSSLADQLSADVLICTNELKLTDRICNDTEQDVRANFWRLVDHFRSKLSDLSAKCTLKGHVEPSHTEVSPGESSWKGDSAEQLKAENQCLVLENKRLLEQVHILRSRNEATKEVLSSTQGDIDEKIRQEIRELKLNSVRHADSVNAELQVNMRSLQLKYDVIKADNAEMQRQCDTWERALSEANESFEDLRKQHHLLLKDHEQLQQLHEQLNLDYDHLRTNAQNLKGQLRQAKQDYIDCANRLEQVTSENRSLSRMSVQWEQENNEKDRDYKLFVALQNEHGALKRSHSNLQRRYEEICKEKGMSQQENRRLRSELNGGELKLTQALVKLENAEDHKRRLELECIKLEHKAETLDRLNATLLEERQALTRQLDGLLAQNHEVLSKALKDKEHFHSEEKELQEKVNQLKRQKEKLEEKIMEHYKIMESPKRKERQAFMKRAAKAFIPRASLRKTKNRAVESSAEDSTVSADESGFHTNSGCDGTSALREGKIGPTKWLANSVSSRTSSSQSSDMACLGPEFHLLPGDMVTLNGTERAVDVPGEPPIKSPPPYESLSMRCGTVSPLKPTLNGGNSFPPNSARPSTTKLPPPYPGKSMVHAAGHSFVRWQPPSPILSRHASSNIASQSSYGLPKASTPKPDDSSSSATTSSSALANLHPGNNSLVSSEPSSHSSGSAPVVKGSRDDVIAVESVTPVRQRSVPTRREPVHSFYDNVDCSQQNDDPKPSDSSNEETLTEALRECKAEQENAVWFEYGCI
uniref:HOOK N-terminal domain-containing protein n=1 Tax=Trichuris muris TaxID=70415 RepID=A0A5S6R2L6_TRIMR